MFEYILREIFLSVIAFLAGAGVSAGVFAFVLVIGVVPRILRCSRIENIILIEKHPPKPQNKVKEFELLNQPLLA